MIKRAAGIGPFMSKTFCVALTLILGVGLFATGAFANSACGGQCMCHSGPMDMNHAKGEQIPLSTDFCNGDPMIPCGLESGQTSDLPEFIPASVGDNLSPTAGLVNRIAGDRIDSFQLRHKTIDQFAGGKPQFEPLYLLKESFLI